jgi:hypothetical protein
MPSIQDSCFVRKAFASDLNLARQQTGLLGQGNRVNGASGLHHAKAQRREDAKTWMNLPLGILRNLAWRPLKKVF